MTSKRAVKKLLLSLYHYFCFFLVMAFVITCCMMLFISTMETTMQLTLTEKDLQKAAKLTFFNVLLLALLCTVIDALRRKYITEKPIRTITAAAERLAAGDYTVRIPPITGLARQTGLEEVANCYNRLAETLAGTERLQTDFMANVSHEMKTPLSVMQNYGKLLQQPDLKDEERLRYATAIVDSCHRQAELVTNILRLSKLENRQIAPYAHRYDLSEQLCSCLLNFEAVWEEKQIDIKTDIAESIWIHADPDLLSLVWNNLLSNALKFTDRGGSVCLSLSAADDCATVCIQDSGCGITPEVGAHMFDKFYQGDTSHATEGSGLGLSLVRRVIDLVDGEIRVASQHGQGTTFTVRIKSL